MSENNQNSYAGKLGNLKRVANQSADMHAAEADRYSIWSTVLTSVAICSSAFLLLFPFASDQFVQRTTGLSSDAFRWINGLFAFSSFSATLILLAWRPSEKAASHVQASRHYTRAKHEIDNALRTAQELTAEEIRDLTDKYLDTKTFPRISDRRFNRLKCRHLLKVEVSRALSANPTQSIRQIRKALKQGRSARDSDTARDSSPEQPP